MMIITVNLETEMEAWRGKGSGLGDSTAVPSCPRGQRGSGVEKGEGDSVGGRDRKPGARLTPVGMALGPHNSR